MSSLAHATSRLPLARFDYWERLIRREFFTALDDRLYQKWSFRGTSSRMLTWLDLISDDGYEREKTLRTISGPAPNAFFFSLALRRLNDWVPQVREAARSGLPMLAGETRPDHVVDALCIALANWSSWGRAESADKRVLLDIAARRDIAGALKDRLISSTFGPMPTLFAQLGRIPVLDDFLGEIAEKAKQPAVRARAYRSQFEGRMVWIEGREWEWIDVRYCEGRLKAVVAERKLDTSASTMALLRKSAQDRSSLVRRVAAEFLIRDLEKIGNEARSLAEQFASDPSGPVSERGRFALRRLDELENAR